LRHQRRRHLLHGSVEARGTEEDVHLHGALGGNDAGHGCDGEVVVGVETRQLVPDGAGGFRAQATREYSG
jgi:hypothetical protein